MRQAKRRRATKTQENVSILSHSAICIAASLFKSLATRCDAHNEN
jgi:hypothetical protein